MDNLLSEKRKQLDNPCICREPEPVNDTWDCFACGKTIPFVTNEEYEAVYISRGWRKEVCSRCRGYGVVSVYSQNDFEGAGDCPNCLSGLIWRSPKGKYALYPGGPFTG